MDSDQRDNWTFMSSTWCLTVDQGLGSGTNPRQRHESPSILPIRLDVRKHRLQDLVVESGHHDSSFDLFETPGGWWHDVFLKTQAWLLFQRDEFVRKLGAVCWQSWERAAEEMSRDNVCVCC